MRYIFACGLLGEDYTLRLDSHGIEDGFLSKKQS
jgi:hypothetical protein